MADKIDFKKSHRPLFSTARTPTVVDVPELRYLTIEGQGPPEGKGFQSGISNLYWIAYSIKFKLKKANRLDFVMPPLEALWWADDPTALKENRREEWRWTAMLLQPSEIIEDDLSEVIQLLKKKRQAVPAHDSIAFSTLSEGRCVQVLHAGPYEEVAPTIHSLHAFAESSGFRLAGKHHEVYLTDPRGNRLEEPKTIVRQPVADATS